MKDGRAVIATVFLCALQVFVALVYKFSQQGGAYQFSPSSALAIAELCKVALSYAALLKQHDGNSSLAVKSIRDGLSTGSMPWHLLGLAFMYCVNNQLAFFQFLFVEPSAIMLIKAAMPLVTAVVAYTMGTKILKVSQLVELLTVCCGLACAQYDPCSGRLAGSVPGLITVVASVIMSSVNSVWNEYSLKTFPASLHVQNVWLYIFGSVLNVAAFFVFKGSDQRGFFEGYTGAGAFVVLCNAFMGVVITAVYKYADAISKTLASTASAVIMVFITWQLFNGRLDVVVVSGAIIVAASIFKYFLASQPDYDKQLGSGGIEVTRIPVQKFLCASVFPLCIVAVAFSLTSIAALFVSSTPAADLATPPP